MNEYTEQDFRQHAELSYPIECCGLIAIVKGRERYFPCGNKSGNKDNFILSPEDYSNVEEQGEITAVCHSHPDVPATPSQADKVSCEVSKLVWYIVRVDKEEEIISSKEITTTEPTGYVAPLVGRVFSHGVLDCYAIVRDWYKQVRNIDLLDFKRADNWWSDGSSDLYTKGFPEAGFVNTGQHLNLEVGDVILMQVRSPNGVPNHAGIYIGDGLMLHHMYGRLSSRDVYGGMWQEYTRAILRYKGNINVGEIDHN
jgi:proteasome lid subunit RPN8/RPN11